MINSPKKDNVKYRLAFSKLWVPLAMLIDTEPPIPKSIPVDIRIHKRGVVMLNAASAFSPINQNHQLSWWFVHRL
jgi:hypothetical protein